MKFTAYPADAPSYKLVGCADPTTLWWTLPHEIQCLLHLASKFQGDILELGCNEGTTTRELAAAFPARTIWACDWKGASRTMCKDQRHECPGERIGVLVRHLPNVNILECQSSALENVALSKLAKVRFIFIDGDHSHHGVRADLAALFGTTPTTTAQLGSQC